MSLQRPQNTRGERAHDGTDASFRIKTISSRTHRIAEAPRRCMDDEVEVAVVTGKVRGEPVEVHARTRELEAQGEGADHDPHSFILRDVAASRSLAP